MLKMLFPFLLGLVSCTSPDYIVFRHIGEIDKLIKCVVITKKSLNQDICEPNISLMVDEAKFGLVEKYVRENTMKSSTGDSNRQSFGSFQIRLDEKMSYEVTGRENSVIYFSDLVKLLMSTGNKDMASTIEKNILVRLVGIKQIEKK